MTDLGGLTELDQEHSVSFALVRWQDEDAGQIIVVVGVFFLADEMGMQPE